MLAKFCSLTYIIALKTKGVNDLYMFAKWENQLTDNILLFFSHSWIFPKLERKTCCTEHC